MHAWLLVLVAGVLSCTGGQPSARKETSVEAPDVIMVSSPAFRDGEPIPARFTCDGAGDAPPLAWAGVPEDAAAVSLVVDDPDAPRGTFALGRARPAPRRRGPARGNRARRRSPGEELRGTAVVLRPVSSQRDTSLQVHGVRAVEAHGTARRGRPRHGAAGGAVGRESEGPVGRHLRTPALRATAPSTARRSRSPWLGHAAACWQASLPAPCRAVRRRVPAARRLAPAPCRVSLSEGPGGADEHF